MPTPLFLVTLQLTLFALLSRQTNTIFDTRAKSTAENAIAAYGMHEPGLATAVCVASLYVRYPLLCDSGQLKRTSLYGRNPGSSVYTSKRNSGYDKRDFA